MYHHRPDGDFTTLFGFFGQRKGALHKLLMALQGGHGFMIHELGFMI
jgi:hypothetical protein